MTTMKLIKPHGDAERATQTTLDTIELTRKLVSVWKSPPFQRDVRVNAKVSGLVDEIKQSGVLPGIVTLGVLEGVIYIVDGQHRLHAFLLSELVVAYVDVRTHYFKTMGQMADEFVKLNSSLVRLRPDDILKGLEQSNEHLQRIRRKCPYVGYDSVRRGTHAPVVSMSMVVRAWFGSRTEVPALAFSSTAAVEQLDETETGHLIDFLGLCFESWHRDPEYGKLWGALNVTLCAWLYRRVVIGAPGKGQSRSMKVTPEEFRRGLLALSAANEYLEYLVGRRISDKDRSPAYNRLKLILQRRYQADKNIRLLLPSPAWAHH